MDLWFLAGQYAGWLTLGKVVWSWIALRNPASVLDSMYAAKLCRRYLDRLKIREIAANGSSKYVPPHVNIFYCFGGLVFTSFVAQITTGAAMTFNYVPEVSRSLASKD